MKRLPIQSKLAAGARWGAWLLVVVILGRSGVFSQPGQNVAALVWLGLTTLYAGLWTLRLPSLTRRAADSSPLILYDVVLSLLPVWLSDGWRSPFLPFAVSALILPTLYRGWRGGLPVAGFFMLIDQLILWTTSQTPLAIVSSGVPATLSLLSRVLLPFGVVFTLAVGMRGALWLRRRVRRRRPAPPAPRREFPSVQTMLESAGVEREPGYSRAAADDTQPARIWGKDRASQQTLERRQPASIQTTLQHLVAELRAANVAVTVQVEGDERQLPPQIYDLLIRATEVALDNILLHAHARSASIVLRIGDDAAHLCVADDGIGLFDGTAEPPGYHQLKRLRFRSQELGGALRVEEREEGGVLLELQAPLTV
jgi:hypothetical protein